VIEERNNVSEEVVEEPRLAEAAGPAEDAPPQDSDGASIHDTAPMPPPAVEAPQAAPSPAESPRSAKEDPPPPAAEEESEEPEEAEAASAEDVPAEDIPKDWYILKVQSNRENSICDGLRRRVKIAGLEAYFGDVIVPTEEVREFKDGKARIVKRKLYPGYIVVQMAINDDTWFLVRETPGIGDFTGAGGKPTPMLPHEVERILRLAGKLERPDSKTGPRPLIPYKVGDKVRIEEGNFQNFEGEVSAIDETNGRVTIMIQIFNRTTPVELEHWQVKPL
jgi:transcriptional antiterminator NusG